MSWQAVDTIPIVIGTAVSAARAEAIRAALLRRAVPLARYHAGKLEPLATALLVADGDAVALMTAAHVFEQVRAGDLVVPLPRARRVAALASVRVRVTAHPRLDLALVWIDDRWLMRDLRANWEACPLSHWWEAVAALTSTYVLAGYPGANARRIDGWVYSKPLVLFTGSLDAGRYAYARTAVRVDGLEINTPELDGVSGATIWSVNEDENAADTVTCVLRPAAVQVAFLHGAHVRAEPISGARELLSRRA
jgi:hypothetical protein